MEREEGRDGLAEVVRAAPSLEAPICDPPVEPVRLRPLDPAARVCQRLQLRADQVD